MDQEHNNPRLSEELKKLFSNSATDKIQHLVHEMCELITRAYNEGVEFGVDACKQCDPAYIKTWHKPNDEPDENEEILYEWESPDATWHDVAFYNKEAKSFSLNHILRRKLADTTKWAYIKDLI